MLQHQSEDESFMCCYYLCTCACVLAFCQMTLIANAMWLRTPARLARCGTNTRKQRVHAHTRTHIVLCIALRWQALIPALAYERQQLEGVAVTGAVCLLCFPFGCSSSVLANLCFNTRHDTPSVCLHLSVTHVLYIDPPP